MPMKNPNRSTSAAGIVIVKPISIPWPSRVVECRAAIGTVA